MSNKQFTPVVFPETHPVLFKIQNPDGSRSYCSDYKTPVKVNQTDLCVYLDSILEHFLRFTNMLDDDVFGSQGFILKTLINHFNNELKVLDHFIRQEVGRIEVLTGHMGLYEDEIVGVSVKPIDRTE